MLQLICICDVKEKETLAEWEMRQDKTCRQYNAVTAQSHCGKIEIYWESSRLKVILKSKNCVATLEDVTRETKLATLTPLPTNFVNNTISSRNHQEGYRANPLRNFHEAT
ncbi:hypothetical protein TNCV_2391011 [Trichonephila clavipes]|nr:hypothetical protein TNCV_2391011 [Trichonephila clavipes]